MNNLEYYLRVYLTKQINKIQVDLKTPSFDYGREEDVKYLVVRLNALREILEQLNLHKEMMG